MGKIVSPHLKWLSFSNKVDLSKAACTKKKKSAWAIWQKYKEVKTESYLINGGIKKILYQLVLTLLHLAFSIASFQQNIQFINSNPFSQTNKLLVFVIMKLTKFLEHKNGEVEDVNSLNTDSPLALIISTVKKII